MTPEEQGRLNSRKAVVSALILASVALLAAAVFLWVIVQRACSRSGPAPAFIGRACPGDFPSLVRLARVAGRTESEPMI